MTEAAGAGHQQTQWPGQRAAIGQLDDRGDQLGRDPLGHAVLRSRSFEEWLKVEDPKDEAMLISLLDRLYVIGVLVVPALR